MELIGSRQNLDHTKRNNRLGLGRVKPLPYGKAWRVAEASAPAIYSIKLNDRTKNAGSCPHFLWNPNAGFGEGIPGAIDLCPPGNHYPAFVKVIPNTSLFQPAGL